MNLSADKCASPAKWDNWNSIQWNKVTRGVKSLQSRIVKAVKAKHFHKARALVFLLARSFYGKLLAIFRVTTNKGSKTCGVDKVLWNTKAKKWKGLEQLTIRGYKAQALKRKSIPKKNGKYRHLGIPTIRDRAMQALFKLGLDAIAETTADPNSYGFRAKRSCADAIEQCHNALCKRNSSQWILEADITGCFDNIAHPWILEHIPINKKVLSQWLKSGYIDKKTWFPTEAGTPQGGIISPTIANMVLDGLEALIQRTVCGNRYRNGLYSNPHKVHYVRYADDFIVTCNNREYLENEIKPIICGFLAERGLELSKEKTNVTHIQDGFDFLGFNVRKYKHKCLTKPKKDSIKGIYASMKECVSQNKAVTQRRLIELLRPKIVGWANFYRHSASKRIFSLMDSKLFTLLWRWACRRHPNKGKYWIKDKYFHSKGNRHWAFMTQDKHRPVILPRFDATRIIRHTKIKSEANPYDKEWAKYFEKRDKKHIGIQNKMDILAYAN